MKKIIFITLLILICNLGFSSQLNNILDSIYYQQTYCAKTTPSKSIIFLKKNAKYAANYCESEQVYTPGETSKSYNKLLSEAKKDPKNYGYLVAIANMNGVGTFGNSQVAEKWLKKAVKAGSDKAKVVYALFLASHIITNECNTVEKSYKCDNQARKLLESANTPMSNTLLVGLYPGNLKVTCKYAKKSVEQGGFNSYPVYVACKTDNFKKPLTGRMKQNLHKVITNKETSIVAKLQAAKILGDKKIYNLLKAIQ